MGSERISVSIIPVAKASSIASIAGMTAAIFGEFEEKNSVASFRIC